MSAGGRVDDLPPLRMRLMHCRGRAAEGLLVFPPEGAGLADALRLGGGHGSDDPPGDDSAGRDDD